MVMAVCTRVITPVLSSASINARAFITVASSPTTSNSSGNYVFSNLQDGVYRIETKGRLQLENAEVRIVAVDGK